MSFWQRMYNDLMGFSSDRHSSIRHIWVTDISFDRSRPMSEGMSAALNRVLYLDKNEAEAGVGELATLVRVKRMWGVKRTDLTPVRDNSVPYLAIYMPLKVLSYIRNNRHHVVGYSNGLDIVWIHYD